MLQGEEDLDPSEIEGQEELDLLEQLNKLNLDDKSPATDEEFQIDTDAAVGLAEASKNILNPSHPVFAKDRRSAKVISNLLEKYSEIGKNRLWSSMDFCISEQFRLGADMHQ